MEMRPFQSGGLGPSPLLSEAGRRGERQAMLAGSMAASLAGVCILMFLLIILFVLACRPWRFFNRRRSSTSIFAKADDIERPLLAERSIDTPDQCYDLVHNFVEEPNNQIDGNTSSQRTVGVVGNVSSPRKHGFVIKKRVSTDFQVSAGDSLVLDVITDASKNLHGGQTLKRSAMPSLPRESAKHARQEDSSYDSKIIVGSRIILEVVAGPSAGLLCSRYSKDNAIRPLTLGRVSPSDLILQDSEVSGKHALINWNIPKSKWELVDMGSLNGTFLNSRAIHHPVIGTRNQSDPVELSNGDIITLGSCSKISVQIVQDVEYELPFGVGIASDPMAMHRGGKKLPMEDVCYCKWPLPGIEQFGFFSIFDGHGGAGAARAASKLLPQIIINILSKPEKKQRLIQCYDASDVLKEAFSLTEAALNHQYEGCTATVLLLWFGYDEEIFVQCANVGDSTCILDVDGNLIIMTEDHRVNSISERTRLSKAGMPLKEGETRLCGLNLGRMLGDKFLKEQDIRFSAAPYISQVVHITKGSTAFGLIASDGLWDVISTKQAVQLAIQMKERNEPRSEKNSAERIADYLLSEARTSRTKDNTSITQLWEVPATTLLKLTIPSASAGEWNRFNSAANIALCPISLLYYFSSFITMDSRLVFIVPHSRFPLWSIVLFVSFCLAIIHFIENEPPETEHTPTAVASFVMSVVWISTMAGELLNCLTAIGTIMNLPPGILGLTVLAWGNSVGDLVADVALARAGQPATAIAGCFAGPMFNMLVGLGSALVMETANLYPEAYKLRLHVSIVVAFVFLLLSLMTSLLVVTWFRFRVPRFWGYSLIGLYLTFTVSSMLIAILSR